MENFLRFRWWVPTEWPGLFETLGPPVTRAFVLAILTWYLARAARASFEHATIKTGADPNFRLLIGRLVYLAILAIGIVTIMDTFGVPLSTLVTVLGVVGIGISLALQDILKNFFAGTYLLFERPFRLGDVISVKEHRGTVETIGVRTTTLRTPENVHIMIPNAIVFSDVVANRTHERPPKPEPTHPGADGEPRAAESNGTQAVAAATGPTPAGALSGASPAQPLAFVSRVVAEKLTQAELRLAELRLAPVPRSLAEFARCQIRRFRV